VDVPVSQGTLNQLFSAVPAYHEFIGSNTLVDNEIFINVETSLDAQYQASSPNALGNWSVNDWIVIDKSVQHGPKSNYKILVKAKPPYVPTRTTIVTFTNILNPADKLDVVIKQTTP
jgi:hypothetical protein